MISRNIFYRNAVVGILTQPLCTCGSYCILNQQIYKCWCISNNPHEHKKSFHRVLRGTRVAFLKAKRGSQTEYESNLMNHFLLAFSPPFLPSFIQLGQICRGAKSLLAHLSSSQLHQSHCAEILTSLFTHWRHHQPPDSCTLLSFMAGVEEIFLVLKHPNLCWTSPGFPACVLMATTAFFHLPCCADLLAPLGPTCSNRLIPYLSHQLGIRKRCTNIN